MIRVRERYDAFVNGVSIRSLSPLIRVTKITENAPQIESELEPHPHTAGQLIMSHQRKALMIQVTFVITEIFDLTARAEVIDAVNAWAQPGVLEVNYRPNRALTINAVSERPAIDGIKTYTGEYSVTFAAYAFPYWQDAMPLTLQPVTASTEESVQVSIPGSHTAYLEASITPSATLTGFRIEADPAGTAIECTGLSVPADTEIKIRYSPEHFLFITAGGTDLRPKVTAASHDNILLIPQKTNTITVSASAESVFKLIIRGVYE